MSEVEPTLLAAHIPFGLNVQRASAVCDAVTLVIGALWRNGMFQGGDRLTTWDGGRRRWDPHANKSIIVQTPRAMTFVGYSGDAYIEGIPTDTWIVSKLADVPWLSERNLIDRSPRLADADPGRLARRLATALDIRVAELAGVHRRGFYLTVQLVSMIRPRPGRPVRPRGTCFCVTATLQPRPSVRLDHIPVPPTWWAHGKHGVPTPFIHQVPDHGGLRRRLDQVLSDPRALVSPSSLGTTMEHVLQRVSQDVPSVGDDVMSIWYWPTWEPKVFVEYVPGKSGHGSIGGFGLTAPAVYTPWYISRYGYFAPRITTSMEMQLGGDPITLSIIGPEQSGLPFVMGGQAQTRRPGPRGQ